MGLFPRPPYLSLMRLLDLKVCFRALAAMISASFGLLLTAYHTARKYPASFPRSLPTDPNCRLWASKTQVVSRNTQCMRDCTLSATRRHYGFGQQAHGIRRNTRRLLECWSNHVSHAVVSVLGISKIFLRSYVYQRKTSL